MPKTRRKMRSKRRKKSRKRRPKKRKISRKKRGGRVPDLAARWPTSNPLGGHEHDITTLWNRVGQLIEIVNRCHPNECRDATAALPVAVPVNQEVRLPPVPPGVREARREIATNLRARGRSVAQIARVTRLAGTGRDRVAHRQPLAAGDANIPTARAIGAADGGGGGGGGGGGEWTCPNAYLCPECAGAPHMAAIEQHAAAARDADDGGGAAAREIAQQAIRNQHAPAGDEGTRLRGSFTPRPRGIRPTRQNTRYHNNDERWILRYMQDLYRGGTWLLPREQACGFVYSDLRDLPPANAERAHAHEVRLCDIAWRRLGGL